MRILFDHGTPGPLIPFREGHAVTRAKQAGWERLVNGELLNAAEATGFEESQSSFSGTRNVLCCADALTGVVVAVNASTPGSCAEVVIPFK